MATVFMGTHSWQGSRDAEGHRHYTVVSRVEGTANDGPASVLTTPGLPIPGQMWAFGEDFDIWAWCRYETEVEPESQGEPNFFWKVTNHFSTKPPEGRARQHDPDSRREDPLLEPPKISGGFNKKTVEITHDRFGRAIRTSSHEPVRGPEVEFDESHPTVTIEFNTLTLDLPLYSYMRDTVNDRDLWGMPKRTVRLADISWERRYWANSFVYYSVKFVFEANARGWDRTLVDEGTKVLSGKWVTTSGQERTWQLVNINGTITPDKTNPAHFIRFKDPQGESTRVVLDGDGKPFVPSPIATCPECPDGATRNWILTGTKVAQVKLTTTGVCSYEGHALSFPRPDFSAELTFESEVHNNWVLTLTQPTDFGDLTHVYVYDPEEPSFWECFGTNRMTLFTGGGLAWPQEVYLSSEERSTPGKIYVQHYGESNFFLLGIPAVLA
jgi:hypothetical protein